MAEHDLERPAPTGVTRRRIVKVGAHAAWTVPTVTLLAAAPAFAVSPTTTLTITNVTATRPTSGTIPMAGPTLNVSLKVNNTGTAATQGVTISVTITPTAPIPTLSDFSTTTSTNVGTRTNPTAQSVRFAYTPATQLPGGQSVTLNQTFTLDPGPAPGNVVITVVANNAASVTTPATTFN